MSADAVSQYVSALRPPKKKSMPERWLFMHSDWVSKVSKCSQRRASMADVNPLGSRSDFHRCSLQDFSSCVARPVEDELEECRRKARCSVSIHDLFHPPSGDSRLGACHPSDEEWKQVAITVIVRLQPATYPTCLSLLLTWFPDSGNFL